MKKGDLFVNKTLHTRAGKLTANPDARLLSLFLGSMVEDRDPNDAARSRLESLGWRQMAMYEATVVIEIEHEDIMLTETFDWTLVYSCLGAVDAVEAAIRFADKMRLDEFERSEVGTPAPLIKKISVGTIEVGPISEDGTPYHGRGPLYFGWSKGEGVALDDHLQTLKEQVQ